MDYNNEPPKIVFEGERFQRPRSFETPTPEIIQWIIKYSGGAVKDEKQASYFLIGFVAVAIIVSLFLIFGRGSNSFSDNKSIIYQEDLTPTARATIPEDVLKTIPYRDAK